MKPTAKTRFLSLLLALALLLSLAPAVLAAEDTPLPPDTQEEGTPPAENPGEDPGENPGGEPGETPGENPSEDPGETPGEEPGEQPGEEPGETPGENPGEEPVDPNHHPFTDVADGKWYSESIQYAYENGLMSGTTATTFDPDGTLTRGMFVTILGRMLGIDKTAYTNNKFKDVRAGSYYEGYVNWAASEKIVSGTDSTHFSPNTPVTREQMASILYRYLIRSDTPILYKYPLGDYFTDADKISNYASNAVMDAWGSGLLTGMGDGRFSPKGQTTRAQAASLFRRLQVYLDEVNQASGKWQTGVIYNVDPLDAEQWIEGATLTIKYNDSEFSVVSDKTGHYQYMLDLSKTLFAVYVTREGFYDKTLWGSREHNVDLTMERMPDKNLTAKYAAYIKTDAFKKDLDQGHWANGELEDGFTFAWSQKGLLGPYYVDLDNDGILEMVVYSYVPEECLSYYALFTYDPKTDKVKFVTNFVAGQDHISRALQEISIDLNIFYSEEESFDTTGFYYYENGTLTWLYSIGVYVKHHPGYDTYVCYFIDENGSTEIPYEDRLKYYWPKDLEHTGIYNINPEHPALVK